MAQSSAEWQHLQKDIISGPLKSVRTHPTSKEQKSGGKYGDYEEESTDSRTEGGHAEAVEGKHARL